MTPDSDRFERHLRESLVELGARAPASPSANAVRARILRRERTPRVLAVSALGVLVVGLLVAIQIERRREGERTVVPVPDHQSAVANAPRPEAPEIAIAPDRSPRVVDAWLPEPIAPDATPAQMRASVLEYFRSLGVSSAYVSKRADGLSFAFADSPALAERVDAELSALLAHFDVVSVRLNGDDFSCSLVRLE